MRALAGLLICSALACAGEDAPSWVREFATTKTPAYSGKVPAVKLLEEERVTVEEGGKLITTRRGAIRVLNKEGRSAAHAADFYLAGAGKIKEFKAWMVSPSGAVTSYGKDKVFDRGVVSDELYDEYRARVIEAGDDAVPGSVFAYESTREEKTVFTQFQYEFQGHLPSLLSRFTLTLPPGWRANSVTFNHANLEPQVSGSAYTWEMRDLPFQDEEPSSPQMGSVAPSIAVSFFPASGGNPGQSRSLASWEDVARWMEELSGSQAAPSDAITAKSKELTAHATTEWEKIQAIGRYVQSVKYVSIQTGLARGGGYKPHAAKDVFQKQYGDCKDKANLMRSMLGTLNIPSYLVSIYSGDRTHVRDGFPSPMQFNHAIIAIKVGEETKAPAVTVDPKLGRLLLFDPTDEFTPAGDLPWHEQGSLALVEAPGSNGLLRVPEMPSNASRLQRTVTGSIMPDGGIQAKLEETSYGQTAVQYRRQLNWRGSAEYRKEMEQWISRHVNGAAVSKLEPADSPNRDQFHLVMEFSGNSYGKVMQNRLLVFRPSIAPTRGVLHLSEDKRVQPVVLNGQTFSETAKLALPAGFKPDELPDDVKLETAFGRYSAHCSVNGRELVFEQNLELNHAVAPPSEYAALKRFFEQVAGAGQAPVVLVRE